MKITDIQVIRSAGPELIEPVERTWSPGRPRRRMGGAVVKVFTDEGLVGLGSPGRGDDGLIEKWFMPQLAGQDPFALERHARQFRNAEFPPESRAVVMRPHADGSVVDQ